MKVIEVMGTVNEQSQLSLALSAGSPAFCGIARGLQAPEFDSGDSPSRMLRFLLTRDK